MVPPPHIDSPPPDTPAPKKRPGCFGIAALTLAVMLALVMMAGWFFIGEASSLAKRALAWLKNAPGSVDSRHITEVFRESITRIEPTHGDVLELATLESDETVAKFDMRTLFGDRLYLGTTESEIRVPVVYRYHLKLSEEWKLETRGNVVTVVAPRIRPTLPPAVRLERMEKKSESGWLRFNKDENLAALEKTLSSTLERRAGSPGRIKQVRDPCRKSVAEFVKNWLLKEPPGSRDGITAIIVVFSDEPEAKNLDKLTALPATLSL